MLKSHHFLILLMCYTLTLTSLEAKTLGITTIAFTAPETNLPMVADVFYPTGDGPPWEKRKSVWVRKPYLEDAPLEGSENGEAKKYPLIIFSHGYQGDRTNCTWIAEQLVEAGYVVINIDHPKANSYEFSQEFVYTSLWQRPKDITAVLDYVLKDPKIAPHIDENRIAAGGFSLGGLTSLWLAGIVADTDSYKSAMITYYARYDVWSKPIWDQISAVDWSLAGKSYRDPRIKAVFSISPDLGAAFKPEGIEKADIPILIIVGDEDKVTPQKTNAQHYAKHLKKTEIVVIKGAAHFTFLNKCTPFGNAILPANLCKATGSAKQDKSQKMAINKIIEFLNKNMR